MSMVDQYPVENRKSYRNNGSIVITKAFTAISRKVVGKSARDWVVLSLRMFASVCGRMFASAKGKQQK